MNARDIKTLVAHAHDDQWQELIILAAGLASHRVDCEKLVKSIIDRGDQEEEKELRYRLHLLAVSCLETALELGKEVKEEVNKRLITVVPPKDISDAQAIAGAGELAVKYLSTKGRKYTATTAAACIRALRVIGSDTALEMLEEYAKDEREPVIDELLAAWDSFDRKDYAKRVLSQTFSSRERLRLERLSSLDGIQYFTNVNQLILFNCSQVSDLSPLLALTQLSSLALSRCSRVSDLSPLSALTQLSSLTLYNCSQVSDLSPLSALTQLSYLTLYDCPLIKKLTPLTTLVNLRKLELHSIQAAIPQSIKGTVNIVYLDSQKGPRLVPFPHI